MENQDENESERKGKEWFWDKTSSDVEDKHKIENTFREAILDQKAKRKWFCTCNGRRSPQIVRDWSSNGNWIVSENQK